MPAEAASATTAGQFSSASANSMCSDTVWQVRAQATDDATQTMIAVTEGVGVRVSTDVVATYCP